MTNIERFTHEGLQCKLLKHDIGHWCGYVKVPESVENVRWTSDYDLKHDEVLAPDVDVWGGITYGPDEDSWVGFDDARAMSVVDHHDAADTPKEAVKLETKHLAGQIAKLQERDNDE